MDKTQLAVPQMFPSSLGQQMHDVQRLQLTVIALVSSPGKRYLLLSFWKGGDRS